MRWWRDVRQGTTLLVGGGEGDAQMERVAGYTVGDEAAPLGPYRYVRHLDGEVVWALGPAESTRHDGRLLGRVVMNVLTARGEVMRVYVGNRSGIRVVR